VDQEVEPAAGAHVASGRACHLLPAYGKVVSTPLQSETQYREKADMSGIPPEAEERVIASHPDGTKKDAEYWLNSQCVGRRHFDPTGEMAGESPCQNGVRHGIQYRWYESGRLLSAEPYEHGVPHGTARQWADDGRLLGTYTLEHGTGIDLWWQDLSDGSVYLAEVHFMRDGQPHGFEWWLNDDRSLWWERHWQHFALHGIERQWNFKGRLCRGYPRYWVDGERVTRRQYLQAADRDSSLPPFRLEENEPRRSFPPEVAAHLKPEASEVP
jgi:hypothetical protein